MDLVNQLNISKESEEKAVAIINQTLGVIERTFGIKRRNVSPELFVQVYNVLFDYEKFKRAAEKLEMLNEEDGSTGGCCGGKCGGVEIVDDIEEDNNEE